MSINLETTSVVFARSIKENETDLWLTGVAEVNGLRVPIGCWADEDGWCDDQWWHPRHEAERVLASIVLGRGLERSEGSPSGVDIQAICTLAGIDTDDLDNFGAQMCYELIEDWKKDTTPIICTNTEIMRSHAENACVAVSNEEDEAYDALKDDYADRIIRAITGALFARGIDYETNGIFRHWQGGHLSHKRSLGNIGCVVRTRGNGNEDEVTRISHIIDQAIKEESARISEDYRQELIVDKIIREDEE